MERKEKRELKKNCNRSISWRVFNPNTDMSSPKKNKTKTLKYIIYLTEKRDGIIKGR